MVEHSAEEHAGNNRGGELCWAIIAMDLPALTMRPLNGAVELSRHSIDRMECSEAFTHAVFCDLFYCTPDEPKQLVGGKCAGGIKLVTRE